MKTNNNSGVILVAVVCFTAITAILALGLLSESGSQLKLADRQVRLEQAFYVAEGGAERAVSCIANSGGNPPGVITGAIGNGTYNVAINQLGGGGQTWYTIASTGEVSGVKKCVIMTGVRQQTWARYALFYSGAPGPIWILGGERFMGPVHANCPIYLTGNPIFEALVSTTANNWGPGSNTNNVQFGQGWQFNAASQSMASVNFPALRTNASLVVTGLTDISLAGTNLLISNARRGWNNVNYAASNAGILTNGLIYVVNAGTGTNRGTASVGGTLDGRLSIATDYDIYVTNHITYAVHPTNGSDDALGLIAQRDVVVRANAPNNLSLFAHIIAAYPNNSSYSHGFYVQNYWSRPFSGNLNVYGGIVEFNRGAVGLTSGRGFLKNYAYDTRFATDPPPMYPTVDNVYQWTSWRDKSP
ncbi:MAG: hypothetical protein KKD33_03070 [Verrucomicrobia bacterium]|nr:hypothetical protein [Verrucomicrobiota bacterium]